MERQLENHAGTVSSAHGLGSLHLRGTFVALAAAVIMSFLTATVCHGFVDSNHSTPITPALLFGAAFWLWWGAVAIAMWWFAQRWPSLLTCSARSLSLHAVLACLLGLTHLTLLQQMLNFAARQWPAWAPAMDYFNLIRFGFEFLLYGFVLGFSGLLHVQSQAQRDAMRSLELEKQLSQAQLKALQMQLEPHFLFNTLNAVTTLVELGRNHEASETLAHLNTILRTTLQRNTPEKIPFAQELQVVESYLAIQQVRFADRLRVRFNTTPDALEGLVPCFILQPIIENAIRHGISHRENDGLLETSVERIGDTLSLRVRDNGPGLNGSSKKSDGHGIGIRNTRERLSYFYPGAYDFITEEPATGGYEVTIRIPYERQSPRA